MRLQLEYSPKKLFRSTSHIEDKLIRPTPRDPKFVLGAFDHVLTEMAKNGGDGVLVRMLILHMRDLDAFDMFRFSTL